MVKNLFPLLNQIRNPSDLRAMDEDSLPAVADELRNYLIDSVSHSGGHFGAGLGCVELTVALHYLHDTPSDRIVWDVGHQAYPHKILTGTNTATDPRVHRATHSLPNSSNATPSTEMSGNS